MESEGTAIVRAILERILRTIQPSVRPRTPPGPNRDPEDIFLENNANEEFGHYRCAAHFLLFFRWIIVHNILVLVIT